MRKALIILLGLLFFQTAQPAMAGPAVNCTNPTKESVRLLCKANEIRARRVQTVIGGALAGALLGNLLAKQNGTNASRAATIGAIAGGLTGYWLNVQNEIKAKSASQTARAAELKAMAAAEAKRQRTSATNLHAELKTVLLRSPSASDDPSKHQIEIAQIARAADVGLRQAQNSAQGFTKVGDGLGAPLNGNNLFASTATDFSRTRTEACSQLTRPESFCG